MSAIPVAALRVRAFRARAAAAGYRRVRFPVDANTARQIASLRDASGLSVVRLVDDLLLHPDAARVVRQALRDGLAQRRDPADEL